MIDNKLPAMLIVNTKLYAIAMEEALDVIQFLIINAINMYQKREYENKIQAVLQNLEMIRRAIDHKNSF
jgi:hypothetical protein